MHTDKRIKALIAIIVILLVWGGLAAADFHGVVTDPKGKPVEDALLISGTQRVRTDREGRFSISLGDSLFVSRLGYHPLRIATRQVSAKLVLQPDPVRLSPYRVFARVGDPFEGAADIVKVAFDPERHYANAAELMDNSGSLQSMGTALKGEVNELSILGNLSRHTLVVVDGVPMNPLGDPFDFGRLDPANIQSVEIIKNNASAYGGAAAIGGIVMITTRKFTPESSFSSHTEMGSYGYLMQNLQLHAVTEGATYSFGISGFRAKNDFKLSAAEQLQAPTDSIRLHNRKADFALNLAIHRQYGIIGMGLAADLEQFRRELPGNLNFLELYREAYIKGFTWHPQFWLTAGKGKLKGKTTLWTNGDRSTYENLLAPLGAMYANYRQIMRSYGAKQELSFQSRWLLTNLYAETIQQEYLYRDLYHILVSDIDTLSTQYNYGSSLQVVFDPFYWLQVKSSLAGRLDIYDTKTHPSGRAELSIRNPGDSFMELGSTWGTSFAMPSPYDLFWKGDSQAIGNPQLKSENSEGYQAWAQGSTPWGGIKGSVHRNRIKNLIQWRQVMNDTAWKPLNVGKAEIKNLELEAWLNPLPCFDVKASALFTEAKDISVESFEEAPYLIYRPRVLYGLSAGLKVGSLKLWGKYSFTGQQYVTVDNLIDPHKAYELIDAGLSYTHRNTFWEITPYFSVQNLMDLDYQVHQYVPEPGRSYFGGIKLRQRT